MCGDAGAEKAGGARPLPARALMVSSGRARLRRVTLRLLRPDVAGTPLACLWLVPAPAAEAAAPAPPPPMLLLTETGDRNRGECAASKDAPTGLAPTELETECPTRTGDTDAPPTRTLEAATELPLPALPRVRLPCTCAADAAAPLAPAIGLDMGAL